MILQQPRSMTISAYLPDAPLRRPKFLIVMRAEAIDKAIDEEPDLGRQVDAGLEGDVDRQTGEVPFIEHRHQSAGSDVVVDNVLGLNQDSHAVERRGAKDL